MLTLPVIDEVLLSPSSSSSSMSVIVVLIDRSSNSDRSTASDAELLSTSIADSMVRVEDLGKEPTAASRGIPEDDAEAARIA